MVKVPKGYKKFETGLSFESANIVADRERRDYNNVIIKKSDLPRSWDVYLKPSKKVGKIKIIRRK